MEEDPNLDFKMTQTAIKLINETLIINDINVVAGLLAMCFLISTRCPKNDKGKALLNNLIESIKSFHDQSP